MTGLVLHGSKLNLVDVVQDSLYSLNNFYFHSNRKCFEYVPVICDNVPSISKDLQTIPEDVPPHSTGQTRSQDHTLELAAECRLMSTDLWSYTVGWKWTVRVYTITAHSFDFWYVKRQQLVDKNHTRALSMQYSVCILSTVEHLNLNLQLIKTGWFPI